jgi:chromosome segregation ATPase
MTRKNNNKKSIANITQLQPINNNDQTTNIFVASVLMRTITEEEYQNLKKENFELQTRFLSITNNERLLQETIKNAKNLTDENEKLREENKLLNKKIIDLEKHINNQDVHIEELTVKYDELTVKHEELTIKHEELTVKHEKLTVKHDELTEKYNDLSNKFINMENKKVFDNFIIAIQDLNSVDELEKKVKISTRKQLIKLKNKRINSCHYLDNREDEDTKNDKRTILENEISNMPSEIKKLFDIKYPNLLEDIVGCIIIKKTFPSIDFIQEMKEWFYE